MDEHNRLSKKNKNLKKKMLYLMLKERIVEVDIKAASKSDISRNPFDRISQIQMFSCLQRLWDILSEINMNDLQGKRSKYETLWNLKPLIR
jgi:hypothetical protein